MKLVPYDEKKLFCKPKQKYSDIRTLVINFQSSGFSCVEVKEFTQKTAGNCCTSINKACKRMHVEHIRAITRKGRVFMYNEILLNKCNGSKKGRA